MPTSGALSGGSLTSVTSAGGTSDPSQHFRSQISFTSDLGAAVECFEDCSKDACEVRGRRAGSQAFTKVSGVKELFTGQGVTEQI